MDKFIEVTAAGDTFYLRMDLIQNFHQQYVSAKHRVLVVIVMQSGLTFEVEQPIDEIKERLS